MQANVRQEIEVSSHWLVSQIRGWGLVSAFKQALETQSDLRESRGWGMCQPGVSWASSLVPFWSCKSSQSLPSNPQHWGKHHVLQA